MHRAPWDWAGSSVELVRAQRSAHTANRRGGRASRAATAHLHNDGFTRFEVRIFRLSEKLIQPTALIGIVGIPHSPARRQPRLRIV